MTVQSVRKRQRIIVDGEVQAVKVINVWSEPHVGASIDMMDGRDWIVERIDETHDTVTLHLEQRPAAEDTPPTQWPLLDADLMTNYDHTIDRVVELQLRDDRVRAAYPGLRFHATCWFADGQFHAAVNVLGVPQAVITAATTDDLMQITCERFGRD